MTADADNACWVLLLIGVMVFTGTVSAEYAELSIIGRLLRIEFHEAAEAELEMGLVVAIVDRAGGVTSGKASDIVPFTTSSGRTAA